MVASENTIFQKENMENQENDVLHDVNRRELIETINEPPGIPAQCNRGRSSQPPADADDKDPGLPGAS